MNKKQKNNQNLLKKFIQNLIKFFKNYIKSAQEKIKYNPKKNNNYLRELQKVLYKINNTKD